MKTSDFNYFLPPELIAQQPLPERAQSRLLCLGRQSGCLTDTLFRVFIDLVSERDLLVFNDTKVIPARLYGRKASGGKVEMLIERVIDDQHALTHIKASKAPKPGSFIELGQNLSCEVLARQDDLFYVHFHTQQSVYELLNTIGHIPLPPYIQREDTDFDSQRYQTVFAKNLGAVAAPTAGLHFDDKLLNQLEAKGVNKAFVTLHVGSGTFQPVRVTQLAEHRMHKEYYVVSDDTVALVNQTKANGGRVIAIGTTSVRALESASVSGTLQAGMGDTELFITPGYSFKVVDALLTNFHLPESTLLMLVSAFAGFEAVKAAYQHAITERYRFFSYGDAMFIS